MYISHKSQCLRSSTYNFKQDCWQDETAFSNHNSDSLQRNCLHYFSWPFPNLHLFLTRLFNLHTADFQQSHREFLSSALLWKFWGLLPLRSPQNCNSVLASMVSSKGKLLSVHFYHRAQKIFPCNSFNAESASPGSANQLVTVHYSSFSKLLNLHEHLHTALVRSLSGNNQANPEKDNTLFYLKKPFLYF